MIGKTTGQQILYRFLPAVPQLKGHCGLCRLIDQLHIARINGRISSQDGLLVYGYDGFCSVQVGRVRNRDVNWISLTKNQHGYANEQDKKTG